jgi:hypothetical protein
MCSALGEVIPKDPILGLRSILLFPGCLRILVSIFLSVTFFPPEREESAKQYPIKAQVRFVPFVLNY